MKRANYSRFEIACVTIRLEPSKSKTFGTFTVLLSLSPVLQGPLESSLEHDSHQLGAVGGTHARHLL